MEAYTGCEITPFIKTTQELVIKLAQDLSEEQLSWAPSPGFPSIAFHLWHLGRWADYLQAAAGRYIPVLGERRQIWEADGLAAQWGMEADKLGELQTGQLLDSEAVATLGLPGKDALLEYTRRAYGAVLEVAGWMDANYPSPAPLPSDEEARKKVLAIRRGLIDFMNHDNRHLGMMECLKGLQTGKGSATV